MTPEEKYINHRHRPHKTLCLDCRTSYCGFCHPICPSCDGRDIEINGEIWRRFYAQRGEDYLTWEFFKNSEPGFFLEIGALDGLRFSNCLMIEQEGWKGICVEAHPNYFPLLQRNRKALCIHAAASDEDGPGTLLANFAGTLSTINPEIKPQAENRYKSLFGGYEETAVDFRRTDSILDEAGVSSVDFVSIDVEGAELLVLAGFDIERFNPSLLVIEAFDRQLGREITAYMENLGYTAGRVMANNLFFTNDESRIELLTKSPVESKIHYWPTPVKHPLHPVCEAH